MKSLPAPTMLSVNVPFSGFYHSLWSDALDDEETQWIEHVEEEPDHYSPAIRAASRTGKLGELLWQASDYRASQEIVARDYVDAFFDRLSEDLGIQPVLVRDRSGEVGEGAQWKIYATGIAYEYEEMVSPSFYNFSTDRLFAKVSLTVLENLFSWLDAHHPGRFEDTVRDMFTSYDGFASFYSNDADALRAKPIAEWDHNELKVLLNAWASTLDDGLELYYAVSEGGTFYQAFDAQVDWEKLERLALDVTFDDLTPEEREEIDRPRCNLTLELPL